MRLLPWIGILLVVILLALLLLRDETPDRFVTEPAQPAAVDAPESALEAQDGATPQPDALELESARESVPAEREEIEQVAPGTVVHGFKVYRRADWLPVSTARMRYERLDEGGPPGEWASASPSGEVEITLPIETDLRIVCDPGTDALDGLTLIFPARDEAGSIRSPVRSDVYVLGSPPIGFEDVQTELYLPRTLEQPLFLSVVSRSGALIEDARVTVYERLGSQIVSQDARRESELRVFGPQPLVKVGKPYKSNVFIAQVHTDLTQAVVVEAPGYRTLKRSVPERSPDAKRPIELTLAPGSSLTGKLIDARDRPVRGAVVRVSPSITALRTRILADPDWATHVWSARSNDSGTFRIDGLPVGEDLLAVVFRRGERVFIANEVIQLEEGATAERTWKIESRQTITGKVVDQNGEPRPQSYVWLSMLPGGSAPIQVEAATADENGRVRFEVDPGKWRISFGGSTEQPFGTAGTNNFNFTAEGASVDFSVPHATGQVVLEAEARPQAGGLLEDF